MSTCQAQKSIVIVENYCYNGSGNLSIIRWVGMNILNFKKEFFGFNKADVTRYIAEMIENNEKHTEELNRKIELLAKENSRLTARNSELEIKRAETEKLKEKTEKLSETVGNLYILAKSGATQILNEAKQSADRIFAQTEVNIEKIEQAQNELKSIDGNLKEISKDFSGNVQKLASSLDDAKREITENAKNTEHYKDAVLSVEHQI